MVANYTQFGYTFLQILHESSCKNNDIIYEEVLAKSLKTKVKKERIRREELVLG